MATYTEYFKLQKPEKTEKYNIDVNNHNADLIDSALHQLDSKSVTKEAVTDALGYTPCKSNEIMEEINAIWKQNSDTESGYVSSSGGQPNKVWGTDENGIPGWIDMISGGDGNHDCGIAPQNVSNIQIKTGSSTLTIFWSDPEDTIIGNQVICAWQGTKLVMKMGAYPENINDGILLVDNQIKNNYKTNGFKVNNLSNENTYYFSMFPYSNTGKVNMNEENRIYGSPKQFRIMTVNIDLNNSNPETCITYADDAVNMTPGSDEWDDFFGHYPVLFKDGEEVGKLNPDNFEQFENGETADITSGDAGDVMIAFPCRGLSISKNDNILTVSMTDDEENENFKYYAHTRGAIIKNKFYLGAYKGYIDAERMRSLSNKIITTNVSIATYRNHAHENGVGYEQSGWNQLVFRQSMYLLKYKNLDSQSSLGYGYFHTSGENMSTGNTDTNGMDYGEETGNYQMKLFGLEDFWGNINEWIDGIYTDGGYTHITTDNKEFINNGYKDGTYIYSHSQYTGFNRIGFIKNVYGNTELGYILSDNSGSSTTFFCDVGTYQTYSSYYYGNALINNGGNVCIGIFSFGSLTGYGSGKTDLVDKNIASRLMFL